MRWLMIPILALASCAEWPASSVRAVKAGIIDDRPQIVRLDLTGDHCSAVIVGTRSLLTAAHCVAGESEFTIALDSGSASATLVARHPHADRPIALAHDLALLETASPLGIAPAQIATSSPMVGANVTVVGFGAPNATTSGDERLSGQASIASVDNGSFSLADGDGNACAGDSGGAVLDQAGALVGIVSAGGASCGESSRHTLLPAFQAWIAANVLDAQFSSAAASDTGPPSIIFGFDRDARGVVPVTVSARDDQSVTAIELLRDGERIGHAVGVDTATFDADLLDGVTLVAHALDGAGNMGSRSEAIGGGCQLAGRPPLWTTLSLLLLGWRRSR